MTQVVIHSGSGQGTNTGVSENGELITRAFDYSIPTFANCNVDDTAFNLKVPEAGKQFVATGAVISGNRDIGVNGSILIVYTASSTSSLTVVETIIEVEVPKSTIFPFLVPNVITAEGAFINAKCDDNSVRVSLYGFFVPEIA